jgi:hypothetical protein
MTQGCHDPGPQLFHRKSPSSHERMRLLAYPQTVDPWTINYDADICFYFAKGDGRSFQARSCLAHVASGTVFIDGKEAK